MDKYNLLYICHHLLIHVPVNQKSDLTFSHHTLHGVRLLCCVLLHASIHRPGKVGLEIPVEVHHVGWQVIPGGSVHDGQTMQRPHVNSVSGPLDPLGQQHQQRCVQRDAQGSQ